MDTHKILVPFNRPDIDEADIARVVETLRSGWITSGPAVRQLEADMREYLGIDHLVCLNSATAGMELVLRALGLGPGDEVITTVYTYAATANIVRHTGARLVLVDTAPGSFAIDPAAVAAAIGPRTKAVIPVDFAGTPCDYAALADLLAAARVDFIASTEFQAVFGRPVILSDAAHAFGSRYRGQRVPDLVDFAVYSFHAVKNLTTAEGGAVAFAGFSHRLCAQSGGTISSSETPRQGLSSFDFERRLRLLALHGQTRDALTKMAAGNWEYDIELSGYKHNMTDMQAALALGQLARYDQQLARRRDICRRYREGLPESVCIHPFSDEALAGSVGGTESSFHIYPLRIRDCDEERRNGLITALALDGIAANVHFKPLPLFTAFRDEYSIKDFPHAWAMYSSEITLPLYPALTDEQVELVIASLRRQLGVSPA